MVYMAIRVTDRKRREDIKKAALDAGSMLTDDDWDVKALGSPGDAEKYLEDDPLINLLCCDVTEPGAIDWVAKVRGTRRECRIMLIASGSVSPLEYLRPSIMASSLLLDPYTARQLAATMREFVSSYFDDMDADNSRVLVIKTRDGRTVLPYDRIYYFEAREKKVFARLRKEEYSFYDTLENLAKTLPDGFVRTHRSFLVNSGKIERVRVADSLVILRDGFDVPLSRSYKADMKEFLT